MTHRRSHTPRLPNFLLGLLLVLCAVADWRQGGIAWRTLAVFAWIISIGPFIAAAGR